MKLEFQVMGTKVSSKLGLLIAEMNDSVTANLSVTLLSQVAVTVL